MEYTRLKIPNRKDVLASHTVIMGIACVLCAKKDWKDAEDLLGQKSVLLFEHLYYFWFFSVRTSRDYSGINGAEKKEMKTETESLII